MTFDFDISADRMMMNIKENDDSVFFGDGFIGGKIDLYGPSKNLSIDVVGSTKEGTNIKIPWSKDYGLVDTSFIKYVDKKSLNNSKYKSSKGGEPIKGLEMNFELDVNPNAEIGIVIDKETGSYLSGRGAGNILMEIDTKGKFNMWGDFITFDGIYNFKNLSLIDKSLTLNRGAQLYGREILFQLKWIWRLFILFQVELTLHCYLITLILIEKFLQKFLFVFREIY